MRNFTWIVWSLMCLCVSTAKAQQQDYTSRVAGAACDDGQYWYIVDASTNGSGNYYRSVGDGYDAVLQMDNWSGRGSSDGSQMTTPFMEYWKDKGSRNQHDGVCSLPDAEIRHQTITGLPAGKYRLSMRVRCYAETYNGVAPLGGVKLFANGSTSDDLLSGKATTSYSGGAHVTSVPELTFEVGTDGRLDFGINVSGASETELNWVAWKDVKLYYLGGNGSLLPGEYYLRNRATGTYLEAGGQWGTQAVVDQHGVPVQVEKVSDSRFTLATDYYNGDIHWLMAQENILYLDGSQQVWTIQPASAEGFFTLHQDGYGYITCDADTWEITPRGTDPTAEGAQWEFVTRHDRIKALIDGTQTDATFMIANPRFDRGYSSGAWSGTFDQGGIDWSGYGNQVAEAWGGKYPTFDIGQLITHLPNGRYQLAVQGYYRYNDTSNNSNDRAVATHADGTEQLLAQLYAQSGTAEQSTPIQSIASEDDLAGSLPMGMETAGNYFSWGYYAANTLTIDVANNRLTLGVRKTEHPGTDWTCWDNFTLTLLQPGNNADYQYEDELPTGDIDFAHATPDSPADCTALIQNPQFDSSSGWTGGLQRGSDGSNSIASYGGTGVANVNFNLYQTLTNIPNGWYRIKAKGFYRYGDVQMEEHDTYGGWNENTQNNVWAVYTIPYATITHRIGTERHLATLFGNNSEVGLPSIFDGAHTTETHSGDFETEFGWVPNTPAAAAEAFTAGDYEVELLVPVTNQTLRLGVKKPTLGYKYDWTCFDDFRLHYLGQQNLVYATDLQVLAAPGLLSSSSSSSSSPAGSGSSAAITSLALTVQEKRRLTATVLPANASEQAVSWSSSNTSVVTVDADGLLTAKAAGTASIYVTALGSEGTSVVKELPVTVGNSTGDAAALVINEIQVSNLDQYLDPSGNYGGYIELYNPTDKGISLHNLYVSDDPDQPLKHRLNSNSGAVPPQGFAIVWFGHSSGESGNYSGNVAFTLDMDGGTIGLYTSDGTPLASQNYPSIPSRTSYARMADGTGTWGITAYPTPGASNSGSREILALGASRLPAPVATQGSGFYAMQDFKPTITGEGTIRFTLDGTVPTEENSLTIDQLPALNQTTVLRLRAFQPGRLPSPVATYTYSAETHRHTLPVLMVTADPTDLYSDERGIFVTGTEGVSGSGINYPCNWNLDWDRSAHMELLDSEGQSLFSQDVNIARFGGWSRSWVPYNFKVKAQKQYEGKEYLQYPFFADSKPYLKHKVLQVRNGGNDVFCRIKDVAIQQMILRSGFYLDCLDYQPVHCYINGRYYGMQNLREPSNKHFALADYGIDTDEMDAMEFGGSVTLKEGTLDAYNQWRNLSYSASDDDAWEQICQMVDVDEFANYMAAELYLGGDDWPTNNCKAFKGNDGKFHIVFFDVDQALRYDQGALNRITSSSAPIIVLFRNMLQNDTFRKLFIDSFCLFGGSVMQVERTHSIIDQLSDEMNPALALEGLSTSPTAEYMKQTLSETRRTTMMNALKSWTYSELSSTRAYRVKFSANIPAAQLQVNGLPVPLANFDGTLFAPAVLKASAPEGYTFTGWKTTDGSWLSRSETLNLSTLGSNEAQNTTLAFQAIYEPLSTDEQRKADIAMPIKVNEVSAGNSIYAGSDTWKRSDWLELYNTTDTPLDVAGLFLSDDPDQPLKFQIQKTSEAQNTIIPAGGHLIVWADNLNTTTALSLSQLHANFKLGNSDGQMVLLLSGDDFVSNNAAYFEAHPDMRNFIDGLSYNAHRGDETVGRFPDGGKNLYRMGRPTIEQTNTLTTADEQVGTDQSLMPLLPDAFTLDLAQGWNWTSHCLYTPFEPVTLSPHAQRIVGQNAEATRNGTRMTGTLNYLDAGRLFKVQMAQADTYTSDRQHCSSQMPIALTAGWNWIGYPVNGTQTLTAALASYKAQEGDKLIGQDGFATYSGGQWVGSLSSFETGKGYLLYTAKAKSFSFRRPENAVNLSQVRLTRRAATNYGVDKYAYPNVMGVIATLLDENGTPADPDRFTLLAYAAGECRGMAKWVGNQLYLTTYGQGNETLQYVALDENDGTAYPVQETLAFTADVQGTPAQPLVFHMGTADPTDIADLASGLSPHTTVVGYYSLSGQQVGLTTPHTPGVYVVKYADGSFRKVYVKADR